MNRRRLPLAAVASLALGSLPVHAQEAPADLILAYGRVKTSSGWEQAVAIRAGVILAVGSTEDVDKLAGPRTRILDLAGKTVLPGLHDSHVHPLFAGLEQFSCALPQGADAPTISAIVKTCAKTSAPGEWITGGNWVAATLKPGEQTKALLDAAAPDNPVLLNDEAHHSIWVNSRALALSRIDRAMPNPPGGIIEHDPAGEPNGLLRENATRLVENTVPRVSLAKRRMALTLAANQMLSYGITSFTVASVRLGDIGPLSALSAEGAIKQRVRGCIVWSPEPDDGNTMGDTLIAARAHYTQLRMRFDCVKMFLDGVPTESHTASMLEPYVDVAGAGDARPRQGLLLTPPAVLSRAVTRFDAMGLTVKFHAAGDGAVRAALDAVAAARQANGFGGPIHTIAHGTFVDAADIPRARDLQLAWEFSPYIWYPTPMASLDIRQAVGPALMERWMPIREALDTGALVVAGSDWSVVPSVNPWLAMETLVTREKPGGSPETLGKKEAITLDDAFRMFTISGARLMGDSDMVGTIAEGMHADLIVTDINPFTTPIREVHATKVQRVFIDGEEVFDAAHSPALTAKAMIAP